MKKPGNRTTAAAVKPAAALASTASAVLAVARKPELPETTEGLPGPGAQEIKKESNPFTDRDWRMLLYAWSGLAVRLLVVFGGIFSVYQFLAAREEKRVERSLALVELWEGEAYQQAERALKQRLAGLNAKYASLLQNPTPEDRAVLAGRIGLEAMTEAGGAMPLPEFQEGFDRIVYFLNRVSFCVAENLCSRAIVDAYFRDYAGSFWTYFQSYVERQRRAGLTSYAMPIEAYVRAAGTPAEAK